MINSELEKLQNGLRMDVVKGFDETKRWPLYRVTTEKTTSPIIISKVKVNPLITTLAMMSIIRGIVFVMTRGLGVSNLPDAFNIIGQAKIIGIQTPIIIMIILVLFGMRLLVT